MTYKPLPAPAEALIAAHAAYLTRRHERDAAEAALKAAEALIPAEIAARDDQAALIAAGNDPLAARDAAAGRLRAAYDAEDQAEAEIGAARDAYLAYEAARRAPEPDAAAPPGYGPALGLIREGLSLIAAAYTGSIRRTAEDLAAERIAEADAAEEAAVEAERYAAAAVRAAELTTAALTTARNAERRAAAADDAAYQAYDAAMRAEEPQREAYEALRALSAAVTLSDGLIAAQREALSAAIREGGPAPDELRAARAALTAAQARYDAARRAEIAADEAISRTHARLIRLVSEVLSA